MFNENKVFKLLKFSFLFIICYRYHMPVNKDYQKNI